VEGSRLSCGQLWISKLVPQNGCGPQPVTVFLSSFWAASAASFFVSGWVGLSSLSKRE